MDETAPSLDDIRARLDAIDTALLDLVDERAALANEVARAKRAAGEGPSFGLRPAREAQILRRLLTTGKSAASKELIIALWRQIMGDSLARQGPFHLAVWGGRDPARTVELARMRFGVQPALRRVERPEDALAAAKTPGGVAVVALAAESAWWGRLLAEPRLKVFAALPCLSRWGPTAALAVADVVVEPSGGDETFWVTDAPGDPAAIEYALSRNGLAGRVLAQAGGLKLFALAGYVQPEDERLTHIPGSLTGVIGAASAPFDL